MKATLQQFIDDYVKLRERMNMVDALTALYNRYCLDSNHTATATEPQSNGTGTATIGSDTPPERTPDSIYIERAEDAAPTLDECHEDAAPPPIGEDGARKGNDNTLYNSAMGVYRAFLKERGTMLDMKGRKAADNARAMRDILDYIRKFIAEQGKPVDDALVLEGLRLMFANWDRLNDYLKNRIKLPDIQYNIEEILLKIKKGATEKQSAKDNLQRYMQGLTKQ